MVSISMPYLSPLGMLELYKKIDVAVAGGVATVSVNKYRNVNNSAGNGGCDDALNVKAALAYASRNKAWDYAGGPVAYMDAFVGKGSPWAIQGILEAFVAYSDTYISTYKRSAGGTGSCARLLADDSISWDATLQGICDICFGLDCNGFVGNWLKVCAPEFKINQNSRPDVVRALRPKATYKTRIDQIEYWDVMCYVANEHIAAIEGKGGSPGSFWVVQSAGGGPRANDMAIVKVPGYTNRFRLAAPTKNDIGKDFYILDLWY